MDKPEIFMAPGPTPVPPEVLAAQMARLHRVAHRVVWVNPLKAAPGYAPLARGMAASLPYVDEFVEGHSLAALETLVEVQQAGAAAGALANAGARHIYLAGRPREAEAKLRDSGVKTFIYAGCDVVATLAEAQRSLGLM